MKTLKEKIEVMKAALDGKEIDADYAYRDKWEATTCPSWNWHDYDYRIKPEPLQLLIDVYKGRTSDHFYDGEYEVASDRNRMARDGQPILKTIKVREVIE